MTEAAEQRARARIGTVVRGKYRIESLLATGSMACVYAATHRNASRVALKVLHPHLARDPAMRERFRREGYFANTIAHPGVPRAIDDDETEDGSAFIVMELLDGETLEQRRQRMGGKLPLTFVLTVADVVLEILSVAHEHKILHRDLKPDNVFLTFGGDVKLLDFGVARWDDGQSQSDMTAAGMVVGTPAFMPPEQALGQRESVDVQSDLWAFGATLFVVITGETVHGGGDAKARLIATARTPARKLQDVAPFVPRAVASVVDRALAFDKKDRWPDALAMREALRWARRSLDAFALDSSNQGQIHRRPSIHPGPPTTRGSYYDEPTRRGLPLDDDEEEDYQTGRHERPEEDEPTLARAYSDEERDVLKKAPQEAERAAAPTEDVESAEETQEVPQVRPSPVPTAEEMSGPVFSLHRAKDDDDGDGTDPAFRAATEPQIRIAAPIPLDSLRSTLPGAGPLSPEPPPVTLPLDRRGVTDSTRTMPMAAVAPAPRPAAGTPATEPPRTAPSAAPPGMAAPMTTMKSASVAPELARSVATSSPPPVTHASSPPATHASSPPVTHASNPPRASNPPLGSTPPAAAAETVQTRSPKSTRPGPTLSALVEPSRTSRARTAGTVALGMLVLGGAGFVVVRQQQAPATADTAAASDEPTTSSAVPAAAPPPAASATTTAVATSTPATPASAPTAVAATEASSHATTTSATVPRAASTKPRTTTRPTTTAATPTTTTTTDTPATTDAPPAAPTPKPEPTEAPHTTPTTEPTGTATATPPASTSTAAPSGGETPTDPKPTATPPVPTPVDPPAPTAKPVPTRMDDDTSLPRME